MSLYINWRVAMDSEKAFQIVDQVFANLDMCAGDNVKNQDHYSFDLQYPNGETSHIVILVRDEKILMMTFVQHGEPVPDEKIIQAYKLADLITKKGIADQVLIHAETKRVILHSQVIMDLAGFNVAECRRETETLLKKIQIPWRMIRELISGGRSAEELLEEHIRNEALARDLSLKKRNDESIKAPSAAVFPAGGCQFLRNKGERIMRILDLGPGRDWRRYLNHIGSEITCVDRALSHESIQTKMGSKILFPGEDVFTFLEGYMEEAFDQIFASRFFEHIHYERIPYLLYLLYTVSRPGTTLQIIVPDYVKVAEDFRTLNHKKMKALTFNRRMIQIHTEVFNEPNDPHQSVWTPMLAEYYMTVEGYWNEPKIEYVALDGRDWYIKIESTSTKQ